MSPRRPYVSFEDVKAICPFLDNLRSDDGFETQRGYARKWLDNAITKHLGYFPWGEVVVDGNVTRACSYYAASEILAAQITPNDDNAYTAMSQRFRKHAESDISTLMVEIKSCHHHSTIFVNLAIGHRGRYA